MKDTTTPTTSEKTTIGISYGPLFDPINKQLDAQGFKYDKKIVQQFEKQRDAIYILRFGHLLTDSILDKVLQKLHINVIKHVAKVNGLKLIIKKR